MAEFKYFDFVGDAIGAAGAGMKIGEHQRKQNALQQIGRLAAGGDYNAARDAAFASGDLNAAKSMQGFQDAQATRGRASANTQMKKDKDDLDFILRGGMAAKTPEQWELVKNEALARGVEKNVVGLMGDFSNRDFFVQRSLPVKQQLDMLNKQNNDTALIQNYKFRKSLGPEQQQAFDDVGKIGGVQKVDTGTGTQLINKRTGQPIREVGKDIRGQKQQEIEGKKLGDARYELPKVISKSKEMLRVIEDLIKHPGRITATGLSGTLSPSNYIPGTDAYNFAALHDQLTGQAFLQAFESIKGGGHITEVEGAKATQAITRIKRGLSEKEYVKELRVLAGVINKGIRRAKGMASGSQLRGGQIQGKGKFEGWSIQKVD